MGTGSDLGEIFASTSDLSGLIRFSSSCVDIYGHLFMPGQPKASVEDGMYEHLMGEGQFTSTQPEWVKDAETAVGFAVIDDRVALHIWSAPDDQSAPFLAVGISIRPDP